MPDSYVAGPAAQAYVQKWVANVQDMIAKISAQSSDKDGAQNNTKDGG